MKGKTCSKLANGLQFYVFKKKLTPGVALSMDITILVKQVFWYISRVSGERLQDHWSSGVVFLMQGLTCLFILYLGTLHVGDEIREINGISVQNQTVENLQKMLVSIYNILL